MNTVIYADILIVINILVNYVLLRASAAVAKLECKPFRLLAASSMGGVFSLFIFVEGLHWVVSAIIKIIYALLCVLVAFNPKNAKVYMKSCVAFLLSNFAFAGIMLAGCVMLFPNMLIYKNGIVYFDIDIFTLAVASLICYALVTVFTRISAAKAPQNTIFDVVIFYGEKNVKGKALFDTGNGLRDSFSGRPVIIAERRFLQELLGVGFSCSTLKNFRMIPYSTIKGGGALESFLADKVVVESANKRTEVNDIYIAVTDKKIISGSYSVLLSTPFFELAENNFIKGKDNNEKQFKK